jgi:hypothetical protein
MKTRAVSITLIAALVIPFWTTVGAGQDVEPLTLVQKYEALIDDTISKCLSKGRFLDSRSPNLRRSAVISCLKAGYLKAHKNELTAYLVEAKAVPNAAIVQYHFNKKFFKMFQPHEVAALMNRNQKPINLHASK